MATVWSLIAYWILPIPLILFLLLSLPLPRNMRRGVLIFTQRVFDMPIIGAFKALHVMLWITAVAFLGGYDAYSMLSTADMGAAYSKEHTGPPVAPVCTYCVLCQTIIGSAVELLAV
jgi:hypothetical protein